MTPDYPMSDTAAPHRRSLLSIIALPLIAFLLGLAAMGWLLTRWDRGAELIGIVQPPPPVAPVLPQQRANPIGTVPGPAGGGTIVIDPEVTRRITALEQRLAGTQQAARAAVGNAGRAEGLLVAFAARRALDRGVPLGYLEALLRERFADTQPQAVGAIITAARRPVTLQQLQDGLADIGPALAGSTPQQTWWDALQAELGNLIVVRRQGAPSSQPGERLRRAERALEAGEVEIALSEVLRLPGRANAREWVEQARRYVTARRALDAIETAALLEPRIGGVPPAPASAPQPGPAPPPVARSAASPPAAGVPRGDAPAP